MSTRGEDAIRVRPGTASDRGERITRRGPTAAEVRRRRDELGGALAELIGTFMLLFFGVGAILAVGGAAEPAQKLLIGLAFGLTILAVAYTFGHVSGAHLNPAITIAQAVSRRLPMEAVAPYVVAQVVGALLGVLAVTAPGEGVGWAGAFLAEVILGFVLMLVFKGTAVDDRSAGPSAGLAVGLTVAAGHLAMIPISGASFNPARSLASAVVGGEWGDLIIYLIAPVLGAVAAALLFERVLRRVDTPEE
jgi:glycerol uptake facilitator-like aquaporin